LLPEGWNGKYVQGISPYLGLAGDALVEDVPEDKY
jgi:hypothetical protein